MATPEYATWTNHQRLKIGALSNYLVKLCLTISLLVITNCPLRTQAGLQVGGIVRENVVYTIGDSPLEVTKDIVVQPDRTITVQAGVTLHFRPGTGITVYGTLIAQGEPDRLIHFIKHPDNDVSSANYNTGSSRFPDLRLVDGDTTLEGRLQLRRNNKWHAVCTNSKNWTQSDVNVACRQLGYKSGTLYHWFDRTNDTRQLMLEQPQCLGNETNIDSCPSWHKKQIGSGVCDYHLDIGIRCHPTLEENSGLLGYWRGLKFENAAFEEKSTTYNNRIRYKESRSKLVNVLIRNAGVDIFRNVSAALSSVGVPPVWRHLRIEDSAATAANFSRVESLYEIEGGHVRRNRGYGIFVNSSFGQVTIRNLAVSENGADGIRYVFREGNQPFSVDNFCTSATFGENQQYPFTLSYNQGRTIADTQKCSRTFKAGRGMTLTAHFPVMVSEADSWNSPGYLTVHDGDGTSTPLLARFAIVNGSRPQSVSSSKEALTVIYHKPYNRTALFTVQVVANIGKAYDLNVTDSNVTNNNGRGIAVEGQRTGTVLNRTVVAGNDYVAGVNLIRGTGDFVLNNSRIENNIGDGFNSTQSGGYTHFDRSVVANNTRRGIAIWYNETSESLAFNFTAHLTYSTVADNGLQGISVWNSCRSDLYWNISMNNFFGNRKAAIRVAICLEYNTANLTTLLITHNEFRASNNLAINLPYLLNVKARVEHNVFKDHKRGVLVASNRDLENFMYTKADLVVRNNEFFNNKGGFVVRLGLVEGSEDQSILFTRNRLFDNEVVESFPGLEPRSRVAAVVAVESTNTVVYRNYLVNPKSKFELGAHLEHHNKAINATMNYWGVRAENVAKEVYEKIFDRKDRFNLALVEFTQYITSSTDLETSLEVSKIDNRDKIFPFDNGNSIGGEVNGIVTLEPKEYHVTRDIYVHPDSELVVKPGSTLNFGQSLGVMVQGTLRSEGNPTSPIKYTVRHGGGPGAANVPIRLSNGTEGRLEVRTVDGWKSVCLYGWDIRDAAVACQQLGLVLNTRDWLLERSQFPASEIPDNIGLSNVQCEDIDTDLTTCLAETLADFENSCPFEVGIRCFPPTWAGIRLGMLARKSYIKYSRIEKAGVVDYATHHFRPALQLDFNRHDIQRVTIVDSSDSGLGVMWNDLYSENGNREVVLGEFTSNKLHGVVTRSQGLNIIKSNFLDNLGSGIHYDPVFTREEQRDLLSWINMNDRKLVVETERANQEVKIPRDEFRFLVFKPIDNREFDFQIKTEPGYHLGIMVLNPFSTSSTEDLTIYGRLGSTGFYDEYPEWNLRRNLSSFPLRRLGFGLSAKYTPGYKADGSLVLYVRSIHGVSGKYNEVDYFPKIRVVDCNVNKCGRGFSSNHYNRDLGHERQYFHRYANESITIRDTVFKDTTEEAVYVATPFWDPGTASLAEINYTLSHVQVSGCKGGIVQYNRDIRNSNNLFHWVINHTFIEQNLRGGINIRLPYVWQYNENYTHSFVLEESTFQQNEEFETIVGGHFAKVNITGNLFRRNHCKLGVLELWGMEKEMLIENNVLEQNTGEFVVQFHLQSHAERFGLVPAEFRKNRLRDNRDNAIRTILEPHHPSSYGLSLRGVQAINVTRNVLENPNMQFELLAGMLTGTINNRVNVENNWWGTTNVTIIRKRIFDFDDWNNYAIANFVPYSSAPSVDAGGIPDQLELRDETDMNKPLGGRLIKSLTLHKRKEPYVIESDLTVMPGVTLTIEEDTELEFHPSIGILVLGELVARGLSDKPITMRPYRSRERFRFDRHIDMANARLCVDEACETQRSDGFLELYNSTTLQWVPVCDPRFSERNAEVICSELGFNRVNVQIKRGPRWDLGTNQLSRIRSWPHPLACDGREKTVADCEFRLNGYSDKYYACSYPGDFVYLYCGQENRPSQEHYWGGIRFSVENFELRKEDYHLTTHNAFIPPVSVLQHVIIESAGILHGEKSPAVQTVQREVLMNHVKVISSASHGLEVMAPPSNIYFDQMEIQNNLGWGVNVLVLSGDASGDVGTSFPLRNIDFPYHVFGMVDICDTKKEITIQERMLLYFKYDYGTADCVKIFNSANEAKEIGFRLLHLNLFNSTGIQSKPDSLRIFDGNIFNYSVPMLGEITMTNNFEENQRVEASFLKSSWNTLSVQLHISGGSNKFGFIAEVVTLPVAFANSRDLRHNVTNSIISDNELGGIAYRSAGENTPAFTISHCRLDFNGKPLFGNFTTTESAVLLDVQNQQHFYFLNNLVLKNQGGLRIYVDSQSSVASLNGKVQNNLFCENENLEAFFIDGLYRVGQYQRINIVQNYFTRNYAMYRDTIVLSQVVSHFRHNLLVNNTGKHIMDVYGFDKVSVSHQTCTENSFFANKATKYMERSTIYAGNVGQGYYNNYFVNQDNDFEIATANRTTYEIKQAVINATYNWWGYNETSAVSGRIRDRRDYEELLEVEFFPYYLSNTTLLSGKCTAGWQQIGDTCFLYVGGQMTHEEARRFCEADNASLPYTKTHKLEDLMYFLGSQQDNYDRFYLRVWVQSIDISPSLCPVLHDGRIIGEKCYQNLPFLCEKDPDIFVSNEYWFKQPIAIAALTVVSIAVFIIMLCFAFWFCKSRAKYQEKLERRNSIRASIRSNSMASFGELGYKRRMERGIKEQPTKITDFKMNGSMDSISKTPQSRLSCSMDDSTQSYDILETRNSHIGYGGTFTDQFAQDPQLENANVEAIVRPTFDLTYENNGYVERGISRASEEDRGSRDWSASTSSTLDMKRALSEQQAREVESRNEFSPSSRASSNESYTTNSSAKEAPLETAM